MEVSGHNIGETKSSRAENIFVEFNSDSEDWYETDEDFYEDDAYYDELDDEELEEAAGRWYKVKHIELGTKKKCTSSDQCTFTNKKGGNSVVITVSIGKENVKVSYSNKGKRITIRKKKPNWKGKVKVQAKVKLYDYTYIIYKYEVKFV